MCVHSFAMVDCIRKQLLKVVTEWSLANERKVIGGWGFPGEEYVVLFQFTH